MARFYDSYKSHYIHVYYAFSTDESRHDRAVKMAKSRRLLYKIAFKNRCLDSSYGCRIEWID